MTVFHTIWTIALVVIFLAIARWAWSADRRERFEEASQLPFEDEEYLIPNKENGQ